MPFYSNKIQAYLLFILISAVILFRSSVEKNNYCTPDSYYYLEVSANILKGLGPVIPITSHYDSATHSSKNLFDKTQFGHPELYQKQYFAIWPLAYPAGILSISYLTGLSPLLASKVFNIILLGIDFYLLTLILGSYSSLAMYYYGSFTMLEICSHTWSENLFITLLLTFILFISKILKQVNYSFSKGIILGIICLSLCLTRYVGVVYIGVLGIIAVYLLFKKRYATLKTVLISTVLATFCFAAYLTINYLQTGFITGIDRISTFNFGIITELFIGLFNQIHIIKQCRFGSNNELFLYLILSITQVMIMIFIYLKTKKSSFATIDIQVQKTIFITSFTYFVFNVLVAFQADLYAPFDYRMLSPFSLPLIVLLLSQIEKSLTESNQYKAI